MDNISRDEYQKCRKFMNFKLENNDHLRNMVLENQDYMEKCLASGKKRKMIKKEKTYRSERNKKDPLKFYYNEDVEYEAGIDEAGRGPMFGRVYVACVILPKDPALFDFSKMKDSKRFSSKKKLLETYNYILENCIDYSICYKDEHEIDALNIREATLQTMHECLDTIKTKPEFLIVDGCDFRKYKDLPHTCIEGGDNWYCSIAAASILAKVARDTYIEKLCEEHPELNEKYGLLKNKGYGTKQHIDGLKTHGITEWHRKTFGICKTLS